MTTAPTLQFDFAALCASRAPLIADGSLLVREAVDEWQAIAKRAGVIDRIGQDETQRIMAEAIAAASLVPELVDEGGPDELAEAYEAEIMLRAAEMVRGWELADPRDSWRHTGGPRPAVQPSPPPRRAAYRPPQATIDAFLYVATLDDIKRLEAWLDDHRRDAPILLKLLKAKLCK